MPLTIETPPTGEPIVLADLKAHLRLEGFAEDAMLTRMITLARQWIEEQAGLSFLPQVFSWQTKVEQQKLYLPRGPVTSIASVEVQKGDSWQLLSAEDWQATTGLNASITLVKELIGQQAKVNITAGYADASAVPAPLLQACLLLAAHFYEQREVVDERRFALVPLALDGLIAPYRQVHL